MLGYSIPPFLSRFENLLRELRSGALQDDGRMLNVSTQRLDAGSNLQKLTTFPDYVHTWSYDDFCGFLMNTMLCPVNLEMLL